MNNNTFHPALLIGNERVQSSVGPEISVLDPASGQIIAEVPEARSTDIDDAVESAEHALSAPAWRDISGGARAKMLWKLADLIEEHADELADLESRNNGMPLRDAQGFTVQSAAEHLRYYAGWTTKIEGAVIPVGFPDTLHYTRREPIGVCALIVPWNGPLLQACWKLAPALACGNTVILKPAPETPLSALRLGELAWEAGFPPGVVNVVTGGRETGRLLAEHPRVRKISFTGSTEVGRSIVRASAGNFKRVTLELGGKAPSIVTPDCDIDQAVAGNLSGAFLNSGQVCAAYARIYVHSSRSEEFAEKFVLAAEAMRLGPGRQADTDLGPLISQRHLDRVHRYAEIGTSEGAELRTGGSRLGGDLAEGFFYPPTVFSGVTDEMTITREEIFGPIVGLLSYDDDDEVLARANATEFGLVASVWSNDLTAAHRFASRLEAGAVYVNMIHAPDVAAPWGGYKASGWGREMGKFALEEYTEVKGIWTHFL